MVIFVGDYNKEVVMEKLGLVGALRRTIMKGVAIAEFTKEYKALNQKDKEELVVNFNKCKSFGDDIEVVVKTI